MDEGQYGFDLKGGDAKRDEQLFAPEIIRREALAFLAEARAVTSDTPWNAGELEYRRILFPHLVSWLPDADEREQLCFAFEQELERIEQLLAA